MRTTIFMLGVIILISGCTSPGRSDQLTEGLSEYLFPICQGGKYGYIDQSGRIVVKPQFEDGKRFREGLAAVQVDGKWGYINGDGRMVIKPQFDAGAHFSEGLARVRVGNEESGRFGFIDKTGKFVLEPRFEEADNYSNGLIAVKLGCGEDWTGWEVGCYGYVDRTGKMVIPPIFESVTDFSEGLAFVNRPGSGCVPVPSSCFIDKTGKVVISDCVSCGWSTRFSEGLAPAEIMNENRQSKWGFMDKTGKLVIKPKFDGVGSFSEGLAAVLNDHEVGFINKKGEVVIEIRFPYSEWHPIFLPSFSEGLVGVCSDDGKYGFIDETGQFVIEPKFDDVWPFSHSLAAVKVGQKWGYIDKSGRFIWGPAGEDPYEREEDDPTEWVVAFEKDGKWGYRQIITEEVIIEPAFDKAEEFLDGLALVVLDGKQGLIDEKGNYVVKPEFDEISSSFKEGFATVRIGKKWGFIDTTGKIVLKPRFELVEDFSDGMALVYDGESGLCGFIDIMGKLAIKPQYEQAQGFSDGLAAVVIDDYWGYIDERGEVAIQPRFDEAGQFSGWMARVGICDEEGYLKEFLIDRSGKTIWRFQD